MTSDQDRLIELQNKAEEVFNAFTDLDAAFLASCNAQERALQAEIRYRLHEYVDQIWEEPKRDPKAPHPANIPAYAGVGALRDLTSWLWTNAQDAQDTAGDDVEAISVKTTVTVEASE